MLFQLLVKLICKDHVILLVVFLYILVIGTRVSAQDPEMTFNYREYNTKNDFYGTNIGAFHQDRFGIMWFGCEAGLYRHDGVKIKQVINFEDTLGYRPGRDPAIQSIKEDDSGSFWFGYFNHLIHFNPGTLEYKVFPIKTNLIHYIETTQSSILWLGTTSGLMKFDMEQGVVTDSYNPDPRRFYFPENWNNLIKPWWEIGFLVHDIQKDPSGRGLWLGTDWGLYFFNPETEAFSVFFPENFPGDIQLREPDLFCNIHAVADMDGTWWIGLGRWLYSFNPQNGSFLPFYEKIADYPDEEDIRMVYLEVDRSDPNRLWIHFEGVGVMVVDKKTLKSHWALSKVSSMKFLNSISFTTLDHSGNYWVGSLMDGICIVNQGRSHFDFISEISQEGWFDTPGYMLRSIDISPERKIWISGGCYLGYYNVNTNVLSQNIFREDGCFSYLDFSSRGIHILRVDPDGNPWTANSYCVKKTDSQSEQSRVYHIAEDLGWVSSILWDKYGFAWILNAKWEIFRLDPESGDYFKLPLDNLDTLYIGELWQGIIDENGDILLCGSFGVKRLEIIEDRNESDVFIDSYQYVNILPTELINGRIGPGKDALSSYRSAFIKDKKGVLWIGTSENGVIRFDPEQDSIRFFTIGDGLADNSVSVIISDDKDRIWIGCEYGLSSLDPQSGEIINFYENDGLISAFFHWNYWGYTSGAAKDQYGNIYLGTSKGVVYFDPDKVLENLIKHPKVFLSGLYINNKLILPSGDHGIINRSISYLPDIHLEHTDQLISIEYAVPEYSDRIKRLRYQHKLEGFDHEWIDTDDRTFITYSNIPAGEYSLLINASTTYNFYEDDAVSINIFMAPPPWATWWAFTLYVLFGLAAIWGFVAWRTSEQKRKLKEIEKINNRLKEVDQLKDQFLANTSHELRTPLQGIIGLAEALKDGVAGQLPAKAIDNLNMINASGKRLANLVNDILDFSKLKKHDLELQIRPVDLRSIIGVVFSVLQPLIKTKELQLSYDIPQGLPWVDADENRLQQVLHNLLGNAIKFTEKGSVHLKAEVIKQAKRKSMVAVSITDTGIGIRTDKQESIFQSFEQVKGGTSREYGGTGLGLSITRQLVELQGGAIGVESKPGKGSTFTFTLPVSSETSGPAASTATERVGTELVGQHAGITEDWEEGMQTVQEEIKNEVKSSPLNGRIDILVVDDEPVNLQVLKNHLSLEGYHVTLANNGMEAMELIEKGNRYDLIILDIMMPRLSGYEVCQKLRKIYLPSELPVVMLTAKNQVLDLVDGFKTGANDYLTKPFSKDELLSRIKTHLNLQRIHRATGKFVPYEFLKAIGRDSITEVNLGDQVHREVSILFLDILEYTTLSENMTPEENFRFINEFVGRLGPVIAENGGFVNQYIGDAIMAIFPGNAQDGLKAAVEMQKELDTFNGERRKEGEKEIRMGIGLHTGPLIMGIIGDSHHAEPTTIADTVNISSRLEGLTRQYGVRIIVSEDCVGQIKVLDRFHLRYLGQALVKGKQKPIKMYECIDGDREEIRKLKINLMKDFESGLDHFYKKEFPEAQVVFKSILKQNAEDTAATYFNKRAARFALKGVSEDWIGIERWDVK